MEFEKFADYLEPVDPAGAVVPVAVDPAEAVVQTAAEAVVPVAVGLADPVVPAEAVEQTDYPAVDLAVDPAVHFGSE